MTGGAGRAGYVLRRLLQAVPVVLAIVVLNFLLLRLAPGDAAQVLAGEAGSATPEYMAQLRQRFGLDRPLAVQLLLYVKSMLVLDLGFSFRHNMPVLDADPRAAGADAAAHGDDARRLGGHRHRAGPPGRRAAGELARHADLDPRPRRRTPRRSSGWA